jgi:rRNA maturation protein Nop10
LRHSTPPKDYFMKSKRYREYRINLKEGEVPSNPAKCPLCGKELEAPNYNCDIDGIQLVFWLTEKI